MGLRSWLREHIQQEDHPTEQNPPTQATAQVAKPATTQPGDEWEPLPAYLPVDPADHMPACVIASAIAAGDRPESTFTVTNVSIANPEYQRVTCIATALAAGALETSSFAVRRIYKKKSALEDTHAA